MINVKKLAEIGCEWKKGDMHRIYFNNAKELLKMEVEYYQTGSIRNAKINGELLSNSKAYTIIKSSKVWYDVKTGKFESKNMEKKYFDIIVSELSEQATEKPENETFYGKNVHEYGLENINEIAQIARMKGHKIESRSDLAKLDPEEQGRIYDVWVD